MTSLEPPGPNPQRDADVAESGAVAGSREQQPPPGLVGIGASAGGIRALVAFFSSVPEQSGIAYVVVMHLSPGYDSHLAEVLQSHVRIPVRQVRERTRLEADHVYVIPPDRSMKVTDGHLQVTPFEEERERRAPIDIFFRTLASTHPEGVGVLLSGSGTDGVVGLKSIKESGGVILAQKPDEAEYDSMPKAAVATGLVDFVLPAAELGAKVVQLRSAGGSWLLPEPETEIDEDTEAVVRRILAQLRSATGHDFSGYKRSTVLRRIGRRMHISQADDLAAYLLLLRASPAESQALLKDLLISVTSFFRDPDAFVALDRDVITRLVGERDDELIRVWVPGCATGEEAYSIAMLLLEHAAARKYAPRIQVFATDLDGDAIAYAREGLYPGVNAADLTDERLRRFFRQEGLDYRVRRELREIVLFSPHDLLRDPPFSRIDLVTCRNLLIYLERDLQERVLGLFRYALRSDGYLFLGSSEGVSEGMPGFRALDKKHRIYQRVAAPRGAAERPPQLPLAAESWQRTSPHYMPHAGMRRPGSDAELHRQALEVHAPPSILVDGGHGILHVSESASRYLQFPAGTPTADLHRAVRPELRLELRSALHHAFEKRESTLTGWLPLVVAGQERRVQLHVQPVSLFDDTPLALVVFLEAPLRELEGNETDPPEAGTQQRLADTEADLDTTRERLQHLIDVSEERHEELRASNEELQSINEEYKSTLEELETSKEELQSVNEELKTVNDELQSKVEQLSRANDDIRNLMAATEIGTLFLDAELRIRRFTRALSAIFNIMPVDEGRPLAHLTHGLVYPEFQRHCREVLDTLQPVEREVRDAGGRHWLTRIMPYSSDTDPIDGVVVTFTDVTRLGEARERLRASEERFRALVTATAEIVWTMDAAGRAVEDAPAWRDFTGQSQDEWSGRGWLDAVHPADRARVEELWTETVRAERPLEAELRLHHAPSDSWRVTAMRAVPVHDADGSVREWVGMVTDITHRKAAEAALLAAKDAAEQAARARSQFLATMSHELRTPMTGVIGTTDLLLTGIPGPITPRQQEHLERITASAWHLVAIIDEVLTYSRTEAGRETASMMQTDLAAIAQEVVDLTQVEAAACGLDLRYTGPDEPLHAVTDPGKFRQIVMNLLGNAVKFTDAGTVELVLDADEHAVELRVHDTGCGIPPDRIEEMFEPFVQFDGSTTRTKGGTGLGLTVARRLARLMGGDVTGVSEPGVGSTFTMRLPRYGSEETTPNLIK
jgi:two-component system, chemotaxis family, CheB/CheR fusion protein